MKQNLICRVLPLKYSLIWLKRFVGWGHIQSRALDESTINSAQFAQKCVCFIQLPREGVLKSKLSMELCEYLSSRLCILKNEDRIFIGIFLSCVLQITLFNVLGILIRELNLVFIFPIIKSLTLKPSCTVYVPQVNIFSGNQLFRSTTCIFASVTKVVCSVQRMFWLQR